MPNCFIMRSSPALAMLARLKWLMKHSAIKRTRMRQRTEVGWIRAGSNGDVIGEPNIKHQAPNTKEDPTSKSQTEHDPARQKHANAGPHLSFGIWDFFGVWDLVFVAFLLFDVWCLVFGVWCLVFGVWCLVFGVWCLVFGVWCF